MVPSFLQKRSKGSFSGRFILQVVVCLIQVGVSLMAMVLIITSRSLARDSKLTFLSLLMLIMLPGLKLIQQMKT